MSIQGLSANITIVESIAAEGEGEGGGGGGGGGGRGEEDKITISLCHDLTEVAMDMLARYTYSNISSLPSRYISSGIYYTVLIYNNM